MGGTKHDANFTQNIGRMRSEPAERPILALSKVSYVNFQAETYCAKSPLFNYSALTSHRETWAAQVLSLRIYFRH